MHIESSREAVACPQVLPCLRVMKRGRGAFDDNNQAQQDFMSVSNFMCVPSCAERSEWLDAMGEFPVARVLTTINTQ